MHTKFFTAIKTSKYSSRVPHKTKMADDCHLEENDKLLHLSNHLTNFDAVLHGDTYWPSDINVFKNSIFQNCKMADDHHFENH